MTDDDRLELELAALRPRGPSVELKRRIAEDLAVTPTSGMSSTKHFWSGMALFAGGLAAGLLVAILWRGDVRPADAQPVTMLEASVAAAFDKTSPSIWSYRCALWQSSHALDDVLNQYDAQTLEHKAGGAPDLLVARFHSDIDSLWGEM